MSAFAKHPLAIAATSAFIAAWLVPAIAQQWQDRQKERELKRDIATQLDRDSTTTIVVVRILIDRRFPEAQTVAARQADVETAPPPEHAHAQASLAAAKERARDVGARIYIRTLSDWLVVRSVTRSTLEAQFPGSKPLEEWKAFADHVSEYVLLAGSPLAGKEERDRRMGLIESLKTYVGPAPRHVSWTVLEYSPDHVPAGVKYGYANATLAEALLERKQTLVEDVLAAHAAGYNSRPRDFIRTLFPFLG